MGTRGTWGFYKEIDKLTYNHFDSYPTCLGKTIIKFIRKHSIEELNTIFENIILVNENDEPTKEQIKECKKYSDLGVSQQTLEEWYSLLRKSQGNPEVYAKDLKYMIDNKDFIKDSLFCEWSYIINLIDNTLEIYKGFQKQIQDNRYKLTNKEIEEVKKTKKERGYGYYNSKLIYKISLEQIKKKNVETIDKFLHKIQKGYKTEIFTNLVK